jgi:hypothetical protein
MGAVALKHANYNVCVFVCSQKEIVDHCEISGSQGGENEDDSHLGHSAVYKRFVNFSVGHDGSQCNG